MNWDEYFITMAIMVAQKSKDPSTKVGCVIVDEDNVVLSIGFNGFPRGVIEIEGHWCDTLYKFDRWERPQKYSWVEHAERNACYNAARKGIQLRGARAYLNWDPSPCEACSRAFIQSGIIEVIGPDVTFAGIGKGVHYDLNYAGVMFKEAGVLRTTIPWPWIIPGDRPVAAINTNYIPCVV